MEANIQMVDLISQYKNIKHEIDEAVIQVMESAHFINGPEVSQFERSLAQYLGVEHVIACANGTDALQIALMALGLQPGDEVIVPAFTYVATAEVIGLLKLTPVMVDVDPDSFNITSDLIEKAITPKTKAIVPVHLFGQCCDMEEILALAQKYQLYVIEDNAQAIGADYTFANGKREKAGTMGIIGTTSFFPSKNLGCYGDGGAMMTNDDKLAAKMRMIANHGQKKKYHHSIIGCNSRLDTIQAAILNIKLKYLDTYCNSRMEVASYYDQALNKLSPISIPYRSTDSTHVFHQYTLKIDGNRDDLQKYLKSKGIPTGIYYPLPLYKQEAFKDYAPKLFNLPNTERLCNSVISLPIHTEMERETQDYIIESIYQYFN